MSLLNWFRRQPRVAASIALIIFSAFAISAKTTQTTPQSGEQVFNLADFNPVGDGVADDGPALQRALDALANAGGGTLLIPAGKYRISTPVEKDFSSVPGAKVTIQGVPSTTMPAPPTADGEQLAASLDLVSEFIPATSADKSAITISNLRQFLIEHVCFTGIETAETDAFITLYMLDIDQATVRHCEFYGISTFGLVAGLGGGNVIRAVRSEISIETTVFLGITANSGAYAPIVENIEWKRFSISNSIFIDYGTRSFFGKTGLGAPLSWINIANAAAITPESPRREVIVRDTFLDEGGWVGISSFPRSWDPATAPIDLVYITGLKMNVSNMGTAGHLFYDVNNLLIENSHYGWSHNTVAAIDLNRLEGHAILDRLTCIDDADRIRTDDRLQRLTVINSTYREIESQAQTITELVTALENDPVQYVRQRFVSMLGRGPDAAAHFYWSDLLIKCGTNNECITQQHAALNEYLSRQPKENFALTGTVKDENGAPLSGVAVSLTGSQSTVMETDSQGNFRFSGLPTSGVYTLAVNKRHYTFTTANQTFVHPHADVTVALSASLNRHTIEGRITRQDGNGISNVVVQIAESPTTITTTDEDGFYSFTELAAGKNYTIVPSLADFVFTPVQTTFNDLSEDRVLDFDCKLTSFSLTGTVTDENGDPITDATVQLTGSKSFTMMTDSQGMFRFTGLPTSGSYTVAVDKRHYSLETSSRSFAQPIDNVEVAFSASLNQYSITGRLTRPSGSGMSGVVVQLAQIPTATATTDANGFYSFADLDAGGSYTVVPLANGFVFGPVTTTFDDLSLNRTANFVGKLKPELHMTDGSPFAALDSVNFMVQPSSLFSSMGFSTDGFMRVMIFASNVEPFSSPSQLSVQAKDDGGQTHTLQVEFIGEVPGQSWLKQLNVKVPSQSLSGKCVQLKLIVADVNSNEARVCIGK